MRNGRIYYADDVQDSDSVNYTVYFADGSFSGVMSGAAIYKMVRESMDLTFDDLIPFTIFSHQS